MVSYSHELSQPPSTTAITSSNSSVFPLLPNVTFTISSIPGVTEIISSTSIVNWWSAEIFPTMVADLFIPLSASTHSVIIWNSSALASLSGFSLIFTESLNPGATTNSVGDSRLNVISLD